VAGRAAIDVSPRATRVYVNKKIFQKISRIGLKTLDKSSR